MGNKPLVLAIVVSSLTVLVGVTCLVASSSFSYRHPQGELFEVRRDGRVVRRKDRSVVAAPSSTAGTPRAVPSHTEHDFGTMDPLTMGQHSFAIRNEGDAPLRIQKGPTSCKCTLSNIARNEVPPGQEVAVTLDWNTGRDRFYSHEATIYTNDLSHRAIHFRIHGSVRVRLGTIPETIRLDDLHPDQATSVDVLVYSQVWDDFDLVDGQSSRDGITWSVEVADHEPLEDATAARRVRVTIPAGMPSGALSEHLQFTARPSDGEETTLDFPITGKVPRLLAVFGKGVRPDGVIDLGQIYEGESLTRRFLIKIRDDQRQLIATRITCQPDFVSAEMVPYDGTTQDAGLAALEITLPRDAPVSSFLGVPMGSLHIDFDHPRIQELDMKLKFAVVESR